MGCPKPHPHPGSWAVTLQACGLDGGTTPLPTSTSRAALSITKQLSHPVLLRGAPHLLEHQWKRKKKDAVSIQSPTNGPMSEGVIRTELVASSSWPYSLALKQLSPTACWQWGWLWNGRFTHSKLDFRKINFKNPTLTDLDADKATGVNEKNQRATVWEKFLRHENRDSSWTLQEDRKSKLSHQYIFTPCCLGFPEAGLRMFLWTLFGPHPL